MLSISTSAVISTSISFQPKQGLAYGADGPAAAPGAKSSGGQLAWGADGPAATGGNQWAWGADGPAAQPANSVNFYA